MDSPCLKAVLESLKMQNRKKSTEDHPWISCISADEETKDKISAIGIRKVARESGLDRKTVRLIASGGSVKTKNYKSLAAYLIRETANRNGYLESRRSSISGVRA